MSETPFHYPAVAVHPNKKLAWFKDKSRRYPDWLKTVENNMKELVTSYSKEWEDDQVELKVVTEPHLASRKLTVTRQKERDELLEMDITRSDEDDNLYVLTMHVDAAYSNHNYTKAAHIDSELAH